jgi:transcriptional regulator with XRE-family HTH domain
MTDGHSVRVAQQGGVSSVAATGTGMHSKTAEERVGANIKACRAKLGLTQAELAEAMQGLGHSWGQTTVAKTEAADRPLRVNEVADLARVLGTQIPHLVTSPSDWESEAIQATLGAYLTHAKRLEVDIEELNHQLALKMQALEETQKRVRELQVEFTDSTGLTDAARLTFPRDTDGEH